ncbi:MAG TPA: hypothetical protein VEB21_14405 [Terriglobales bacterium]|nr:hypothetical protein [Terriglobales bacterium]
MGIDNPAPKPVTVGNLTIDVRADFATLAMAEQKFNVNLLGLNPFAIGLRGIQAVLWASAAQQGNHLTPERVGELIQQSIVERKFDAVLEAVGQAINSAYGLTEEGENSADPK